MNIHEFLVVIIWRIYISSNAVPRYLLKSVFDIGQMLCSFSCIFDVTEFGGPRGTTHNPDLDNMKKKIILKTANVLNFVLAGATGRWPTWPTVATDNI